MKKFRLGMATLAIATAGLFAFKGFQNGTIKGTVSPAEGATQAWALSSSDTLKVAISKGTYEISDAKPGTYRIIIEAKAPFKNAAKDGVIVKEGETTEVGEIKLEQ